MKNGWTQECIHDRLKKVMDELERVRAELDDLICDEGEQIHVRASALGDGFFLYDVSIHKGPKYRSVTTGYMSRGVRVEGDPYSGDISAKAADGADAG